MITEATAAHVPIEAADRWRWWEPVRLHPGRPWFYGVRGSETRSASHPHPQTVDRPLRPLVVLLRRAGLPTLPSCAGHHVTVQGLRATYRALQRDAVWIAGHGLTVRCSETGALSLLRVPGWRLPPFPAWAAPILASSGHGRIGIVVPSNVARRWAATIEASTPAATVLLRPAQGSIILDVRVRTSTPASQRAAWRAVTAAVSRLTGSDRTGGGSFQRR